MKRRKGPLDKIFKSYYRQYRTYDGLRFIHNRTIYRVKDTKRVVEVRDSQGKAILQMRIPYINLFQKLSDALAPGTATYQTFQNQVLEKGSGDLSLSTLSFKLYKEKDSVIVMRENGIEVVFDNIPEALNHVRRTLRDKLDVHICDAEYNKGDKIILGVNEEGVEKVGTVKDVNGDSIILDIDGAEVKTTSEDLNEQLEEKLDGGIADDDTELDDEPDDDFDDDDEFDDDEFDDELN